MTRSLQVLFGDDTAVRPAEAEFYDLFDTLEIEENADLPGAFQCTLPVATRPAGTGEDLTVVDDERFRPYSRVAVVVGVEDERDACIFDGYVLAHGIHLDSGTTAATAQVWGQDASCLMNLVEKTKERPGTDGNIANAIFGDYRFRTSDANLVDDGPEHTLKRHVLMQRGTDLQFLRERARRTGRLLRVCCDERPGENTGYFIKPNLDGEAVMMLSLNPVDSANVQSLRFSWDVIRPADVMAEALVRAKDPVKGDAQQSGLSLLDQRSLGDFAGESRITKVRLTATVDDAGELRRRAESLLREAGWFVRCEGEADLASLPRVPRVGTIVSIDGAGKLHSGKYFVWSVRHTISADSHRIAFVLVRNAVGAS
jgi:hypothetical protein